MKRHNIKRSFAAILLALVMLVPVPLSVNAGTTALSPVTPVRNKTLKVLFIGNSFSLDTVKYIGNIVGQTGYKISIGNAWISKSRLADHADNARTDAQAYAYRENMMGIWYIREHDGSSSWKLSWVLSRKKWDLIIFQSLSVDVGNISTFYPEGDMSGTSYLEELALYCHQFCPGARYGYNMTWALPSYSDLEGFAFYGSQMGMIRAAWDTTKTLLERTGGGALDNRALPSSQEVFSGRKGSGDLIVKSRPSGAPPIEFVIPTGTAVQNVRSSYFGDTLNRDNRHLTRGIGRFTASMTAAASLGYPVGKVSKMDLTQPASLLHLPLIRSGARDAVREPFALSEQTQERPVLGDVKMTVTHRGRKVTVKWKKVKGAMSYRVRYKLPGMTSYKAVDVGADTTFFTFRGKKGANRIRVYAVGDDFAERGPSAYKKIWLP